MGATSSLFKTLFIPAFISLAIYLLFSYIILPFARRHRNKYSQYLPANRFASGTSPLRHRIAELLLAFIPSWHLVGERQVFYDGSAAFQTDDGSLYDEEEGEGMVPFEVNSQRREALERQRSGLGDADRRLSRDLEEGFRDDSDEEPEVPERQT
ncbi:MAG: hypothetical protein M1829_004321 [Trizodia sp. TS-e1964]|nr:MAG: hypothetical protein M1829_004321 [Trizodia sp. TS-e1964]